MKKDKIIYVEDYTIPGDADSAEGIRHALADAAKNGAGIVAFQSGTYFLHSCEAFQTVGMLHDAGSKTTESFKDVHIAVQGFHGLTLLGEIDEHGKPATILAGYNNEKIHDFLPSILWCEDNEDLTIENLAFTRFPEFGSAGKVLEKDTQGITVEIPKGNHCADIMGTHCMNRFTPDGTTLVGESISYGPGTGENWVRTGERTLHLQNAKIADKVNEGDWIAWHQGAQTDFQTYFSRCNNLTFKNVHTINSNGFAMLSENCRNITASDISFRPRKGMLFTAPRDAWKLFKCTGKIEIIRMYIEGVRMDGQNMHSNWMVFKNKLSENRAVFFCRYTFAELRKNGIIEFYDKQGGMYPLSIESWEYLGSKDNGGLCEITFSQPIPNFAEEGILCAARDWEPERYLCRDSEFINIAGAGHLVRFDHVHILNCTYRNMMNPGILLGAELPTHAEGGHATDILIKGCTFDNCGFVPRYSTSKASCIGIDSAGFSVPGNRNIVITGNQFANSKIGIFVRDARDVYIMQNQFHQVERPVEIDFQTTEHIMCEF